MNMTYDYSTKNFHRYSKTVPSEAINEVYVSRAHMPKPLADIIVTVDWNKTAQPVAEKAKPAK